MYWRALIQLALLYICMLYRPRLSAENLGVSSRLYSFWQWPTYSQHIEFLAGMMCAVFPELWIYFQPARLCSLIQSILFLVFGRSDIFIYILGFASLGLESTLPIPQFIRWADNAGTWISCFNKLTIIWKQLQTKIPVWFPCFYTTGMVCRWCLQVCYYFLSQTLVNHWLHRTVYFFIQRSPLQFKVCAIFQLSIDCGMALFLQVSEIWLILMITTAIVAQRLYYGTNPPSATLTEDDDIEQALALAEEWNHW